MTIEEKNEILKDVEEIKSDCDYITRRIQILKSNAKAVADALAYEAKKELAVVTANAPGDAMQPCVQETQWDRDLAAAEAVMPLAFAHNAAIHYAKALRKHPRFADALFGDDAADDAKDVLDSMRRELDYLAKNNWLDASALATCEIAEAQLANAQGNAAETISELYDAVAVLMRMIAVVEGKQKLGGEE